MIDLKDIIDRRWSRMIESPLELELPLLLEEAEADIAELVEEVCRLKKYAPKQGGVSVHYGPIPGEAMCVSACRVYRRTREDFEKVPAYFTRDFEAVTCKSCSRSTVMRADRQRAERVPL